MMNGPINIREYEVKKGFVEADGELTVDIQCFDMYNKYKLKPFLFTW